MRTRTPDRTQCHIVLLIGPSFSEKISGRLNYIEFSTPTSQVSCSMWIYHLALIISITYLSYHIISLTTYFQGYNNIIKDYFLVGMNHLSG